ncbi:MAG: alpha-galactosidase [Clostridia bacterium]|nr:alpha-galactosidase [Clostridia bacterium]
MEKRVFPYADFHLAGTKGLRPAFVLGEASERETVYENGKALLRTGSGALLTAVTEEVVPGVSRQTVFLENGGEKELKAEEISSLYYDGFGENVFEKGRYVFHFCEYTWGGEGQWRAFSPEETGLYPNRNHPPISFFSLRSVGSWSSGKFYPLLLIEDKKEKKTAFFEIETGTSWTIEVGARQRETGETVFTVFTSGSSCQNDGWHIALKPGETYQTVSTLFGISDGGKESALCLLLSAKRKSNLAAYPLKKTPPVIYNDYMNALWGKPCKESTLPMIDAAKEAGAEIFCIDAGWFRSRLPGHTHFYGDWVPGDDLFGEGGFRGVISYIRSKGMKPGAWLEIEVCQIGSQIAKEHPEWLLRRDGEIISHNMRHFFDFRQEEVCSYLMGTIDYFHKIGIRYIKNDYNESVGYAADGDPCPQEALRQNHLALCRFFDRVREKYPDMILENCGSGAMREDNLTLSRFHLQSVSDQENYLLTPSVLQGSLCLIPPEKAGVWAYPYPIPYTPLSVQDSFLPDPAYRQRMASGRQTAFNMVTGLFGCMMLSGGIHLCDETNKTLIKAGVKAYKKIRSLIGAALPSYPNGQIGLSESGNTSLALRRPDTGETLLGVFHIGTPETAITVPLNGLLTDNARITRLYPRDAGIRFRVNRKAGTLKVFFPPESSAVAFWIK